MAVVINTALCNTRNIRDLIEPEDYVPTKTGSAVLFMTHGILRLLVCT